MIPLSERNPERVMFLEKDRSELRAPKYVGSEQRGQHAKMAGTRNLSYFSLPSFAQMSMDTLQSYTECMCVKFLEALKTLKTH